MIKLSKNTLNLFNYCFLLIFFSILLILLNNNVNYYLNFEEKTLSRLNILLNLLTTITGFFLFFYSIKLFNSKHFNKNYKLFENYFTNLDFNKFINLLIFFFIIIIYLNKIIISNNIEEILGVNSYRATHWFFNYQDLGFIKRGLPGTVLNLFIDKANYLKIVLISTIIFITLIYLLSGITKKFLKNTSYQEKLLLISFFSSPGLILGIFMENGRFDHIGNILMLLSLLIFYKNQSIKNIFYISIFSSLGLLVHEAYLFLNFPIVFLIIFFYYFDKFKKNKNIYYFKPLIVLFLFPILTGIFLLYFGYRNFIEIGIIKNFLFLNYENINEGVIDTFSYNPFKNLIFFKDTLCTDKLLCPLYTLSSFLIFNSIFFLFFFNFLLSFKKKYFKSNILLFCSTIFLILFTFFIKHMITFVDYYRVHTMILLLSFLIFVHFRYEFKKINFFSFINKKNYFYSTLIILFLNLNLYLVQIFTMTSSSSIDIINKFLFNVFN